MPMNVLLLPVCILNTKMEITTELCLYDQTIVVVRADKSSIENWDINTHIDITT